MSCFAVEKVEVSLAETEGEGAASAERKRVRNRSPEKNQTHSGVFLNLFLIFLSLSLPVTLSSSSEVSLECRRHTIRTYYTRDKSLFSKKQQQFVFGAGGKQPCFGQGNLTVSVVQEWALEC